MSAPASSLLEMVLSLSTDAPDDRLLTLLSAPNALDGDYINYQDEQGRSPLGVVATMAGRLDFVEALATHPNIELRLRDARLRTPLLLAAEHDHTATLRFLLESLSARETGWQLAEEQDCYQRGPLHYMCQHRNVEGVIALLVVAGAAAVGLKEGEEEEEEEEEEKKERIKTVVNAKTSSGETPLFWLVQSLSASKEDIKGESGAVKEKKSSSSSCCSNDANILEIAELLLTAGADPHIGNAMGQTPADLCVEGEGGREGGLKARLRAMLSPRKASTEEEEEEVVKQRVKGEMEGKGSRSSTMTVSSTVPPAASAPASGIFSSFPTRGGGFSAGNSSSSTTSNISSISSSSRIGGSVPKKLKIKLKAPTANKEES